MNEHILVLVTCPPGSARKISERVLKSRAAACVSVATGLRSLYWWNGRLVRAKENLLLIKTTKSRLGYLEKVVKGVHPYKMPEIVSFRMEGGNRDYLRWISEETGKQV